jgi:branched-subunit amino acid aminotransferase/4-amino-4-deoxychorismate lyase
MTFPCYINYKFIDSRDLPFPINDFGLQRGYAVFDYIRTYNGRLFHPLSHVQRLRRSGSELRISLNLTDSEIVNIAELLVKDSDFLDPSVRLMLLAGQPDESFNFPNSNFIAISEPLQYYGNNLYEQGAELVTYEFQREVPEVKSINYLNSVKLEPWRRELGVFDILYCNNGEITESPRSNFFAFFDDILVTPGSRILKGITRNSVIDLAQSHFKVEESSIKLSDLPKMTEAFVTSTSKRIMPVVKINGEIIGSGQVGHRTSKIMGLFDDLTNNW